MTRLFTGGVLLSALALFCAGVLGAGEAVLPPIPGGSEMPDIPDNSPAGRDTVEAARSASAVTPATSGASAPERSSDIPSDIPVPAQKKAVTGTATNPVVNKIIVRGPYITDSEIKSRLGTREGDLLNRKVLEEDFQRLYKMGRFADVQIKEEIIPGTTSVNIIVLLREKNVIKRVSFRGNKGIKSNKLLKLVKSTSGERYDEGQANRDVRAIEDEYKDKFYYFVKIKAHPEPFEDGVKIVFDVDEGSKLWVRDIFMRGNYRFTSKVLKNVMKTRGSTFFTRGKLTRRDFEEDLERLRMFYQSNGYLDVTITERPFQITSNLPGTSWSDRREAHIFIDIEEGEQYRIGSVTFKGNGLVKDGAIRNVIKCMPGKIYSPIQAAEDAKTIRDIYGQYPNSRYFTKVSPERVLTEQPNVVDVVFHIVESPQVVIEDVQIVGNVKTKDKVFRRELEFFPGEMIDSRKINRSKENIANLDYVKAESFNIDVKEGSAPNRGRVVVDLEEKSTGNFSFGVGVSTQEPLAGSITLTQRNFDYADLPSSFKEFITGKSFVGGGQYASVSMSMGTRSKNIGFDYMNPWIFDKPISWGFGPYWKTYEWDDFTDERLGFYTTVGRRLWSPRFKGSLTYRLEQVDMTHINSSSPPEVLAEEGKNYLSSMAFNLTWDSRNNIFDPEKGTILSNTFKVYGGPFGGSYDFWSNFTKFQTYYSFFTDRKDRNWVVSWRSDFGAMDKYGDTDHVPVYEKLYAGGIGSVRGWRMNTLGPHSNGVAIGGLTTQTNSLEVFVPIYDKLIRGSWFLDFGGAFPDPWSLSGGAREGAYGGSGYRVSTGPGIHVKTPFSSMPVRVFIPFALNNVDGDNTEIVQFAFGAIF